MKSHRNKLILSGLGSVNVLLAEKDKTFLENLKNLIESKDLWVELKPKEQKMIVSVWAKKKSLWFHVN